MRLLRFIRIEHGKYKNHSAVSRIATAEYKLKSFYLADRTSGTYADSVVVEQEHTVRLMNTRFHCAVAKQGNGPSGSAQHHTDCFNVLSELVVDYEVRFVAGDFYMA